MQRHLRLCRSEDFQRLREVGVVQRHPLMVLSFSQNELMHNRYGFIVGKQLGNAVARNRTRRRLREIVRAFDRQAKPGHDIVLIARRPLAEQPFEVFVRTVNDLFRRAELFQDGVSERDVQ